MSKVLRGVGRTAIVLLVTILMVLVLALEACSVLAWASTTGWYINVIGFDANNILHVGDMSGQQALDLGMPRR